MTSGHKQRVSSGFYLFIGRLLIACSSRLLARQLPFISATAPSRATAQRIFLAAIVLVLSGCGAKQVVVEGIFPPPVMEPLPLTLGVVYSDEFKNHEIYDEAAGKAESDWIVQTGGAQMEFWSTLFRGMFQKVVRIKDHETLHKHQDEVDVVLIPIIEDLQYTIPMYTNVKVYEIWMKYRFRMVTVEDIHDHENGNLTYHPAQSLADWTLTAYGKTPTAFMQSDEKAVNLAAVVALRDAGANFVTSFERVPAVAEWLDTRGAGQ